MVIKKEKMLEYFRAIAEFAEKFPMLTWKDVNITELAKLWGYPAIELMASIAFLDAIKTANQHSEKGIYVDMEKVKKIKAAKKGDAWEFIVESTENKTFKIKHKK